MVMIEEVKKYTNEKGMSVTAYIPLSEETDVLMNTRYDGTVGIRTPMGVQPIQFPFPKDFTLEQCFEKFEEVADVEIKKIMEEAEAKQKEDNLIVTPGQAKQPLQFPGSK
jgi:hypothetical protein